ncbi:ParB N-terminal domain-containing protein [Halalkalibacter oceani]|uniref:ParB N-terminal domain-containing protein n=1 Tax=Halalkalibacter oceani TaxID=1653776 RepID=UPI00339173AF
MNIMAIPVTKINPAPYNPRVDLQPGDPEYEKLQRSINEFGYVEPLVWNERTGNLVGGHQRFKILLESNPSHIDVSVVDLDLEKEKALNIALNKISGDWDEEKLALVLKDLTNSPVGIELTGCLWHTRNVGNGS